MTAWVMKKKEKMFVRKVRSSCSGVIWVIES